MKRTLLLVLFYACYSVDADLNLRSEILNGLDKFDSNATFEDTFEVRVPKYYKADFVDCVGNFSRELMALLNHVQVTGDMNKLINLKSRVRLWVERNQQTHNNCQLKTPKDRNVKTVLQAYAHFIRRLNRSTTTKKPTATKRSR